MAFLAFYQSFDADIFRNTWLLFSSVHSSNCAKKAFVHKDVVFLGYRRVYTSDRLVWYCRKRGLYFACFCLIWPDYFSIYGLTGGASWNERQSPAERPSQLRAFIGLFRWTFFYFSFFVVVVLDFYAESWTKWAYRSPSWVGRRESPSIGRGSRFSRGNLGFGMADDIVAKLPRNGAEFSRSTIFFEYWMTDQWNLVGYFWITPQFFWKIGSVENSAISCHHSLWQELYEHPAVYFCVSTNFLDAETFWTPCT